MYHALFKGAAPVERRANCTYDPVHDIPHSDCSNHFQTAEMKTFFGMQADTQHGKCINDTCVCLEGFTGKSDWINLDGKDCQVYNLVTRMYGLLGIITTTLLFTCIGRVVFKTYKNSNAKDRTIRSQLAKNPNRMAAFLFISSLPIHILSVIKYISPSTIMVDPAVNPFFFIYVFLSLNGEWWALALLFRSICEPFIQGIQRQSDRKVISTAKKVATVSNSIPIVDLHLRIFLIILPAIYGAVSKNMNVTIAVFLFQRWYGSTKYFVAGMICLYNVHNVMKTLEKEQDRPSPSGSTMDEKLRIFKVKIKIGEYPLTFVLILLAIYNICCLFFLGNNQYGLFGFAFLGLRAIIVLHFAIMLEIMYLDIMPRVITSLFRYCTKEGAREKSLNLTAGSFVKKTVARNFGVIVKESSTFNVENPMLESKGRV